jgi:FMN-dependent NADH-azoreductase
VTFKRVYPAYATTYVGSRRGTAAYRDTDMKLLHLDSSALGANSVTRELTRAVTARWQASVPDLQVEYRDLDAQPIAHLTGNALAKADADAASEAERLLQQFLDADVIVLGAPMYNFAIPSTLKAWIDRIAVAGRTFRYTENGPEGLAGGKRVIVASGRGGVHTDQPTDFVEPYLRQVFGFLGIEEVEFVRAEGVALSPQHREEAISSALGAIPEPLRLAA